jgi:hypothetical protein
MELIVNKSEQNTIENNSICFTYNCIVIALAIILFVAIQSNLHRQREDGLIFGYDI